MTTDACEVLEVGMGAEELVGALLGLDRSRGLHLLDSCGARGDDARLLIAGFDPVETVEARGEELLTRARGTRTPRARRGHVL
ncbi:MAG TPA: hypothetical protein VD968_07775, partial [Pyrinomonadaceae bacterium]|nr:hypothetical protein [Pyrinomonadaceae bacterium]